MTNKVNHLGIEADNKREWLYKALEQGLPVDGCWEWPWYLTEKGYGRISLRIDGVKVNKRVHVLACEHYHGPKPTPEHQVAHAPFVCTSKSCFRPDHIRWATPQENTDDMVLEGTNANNQPSVPLHQAAFICNLYSLGKWTMQELADIYGVSYNVINKIINGKGIYGKISTLNP
jgi:hypothetical protein